MKLAKGILRLLGWKVIYSVPDYPKAIICVAPHTSNWDFILGELVWTSLGHRAGFLMKSTWFFWPLGCFFRAIGGVPVPRGKKRKGRSVTEVVVEKFNRAERLNLAITPEGTRSRTADWHTGFLRIAQTAQVPIILGALDYGTKTVHLEQTFTPTGDLEADMRYIKDYYAPYVGKYPQKFTTE